MQIWVKKLLSKVAESDESQNVAVEKLVKYLDCNLVKLKTKLASSTTFDHVFSIIWERVLGTLETFIATNVEVSFKPLFTIATSLFIVNIVQKNCSLQKQRQPSFFKRIQKILCNLKNLFYPANTSLTQHDKNFQPNENLATMENLLENLSASTTDLVIKYCQERYKTQEKILSEKRLAELGFLAVRTCYCEDIQTLRIELLNARRLKPRCKGNCC